MPQFQDPPPKEEEEQILFDKINMKTNVEKVGGRGLQVSKGRYAARNLRELVGTVWVREQKRF